MEIEYIRRYIYNMNEQWENDSTIQKNKKIVIMKTLSVKLNIYIYVYLCLYWRLSILLNDVFSHITIIKSLLLMKVTL